MKARGMCVQRMLHEGSRYVCAGCFMKARGMCRPCV